MASATSCLLNGLNGVMFWVILFAEVDCRFGSHWDSFPNVDECEIARGLVC